MTPTDRFRAFNALAAQIEIENQWPRGTLHFSWHELLMNDTDEAMAALLEAREHNYVETLRLRTVN